MTDLRLTNEIKNDEFAAEILINKFRFFIALLFSFVFLINAFLRKIDALEPLPFYSYIPCLFFILYSLYLFVYLKSKSYVHPLFKYISVFSDISIIAVSIYVNCGYPHIDPPISYLSIWALFFIVIIMLGAFRYSVKCALFSGLYSGFCYLIVFMLRADALNLPYFTELNENTISVDFPLFNELYRVIAMIVSGAIAGLACKRHLKLFSNMVETQSHAAQMASNTVEKTQIMASTIKKSTDDIFMSSKGIFSIANNQAASIQEIEATIKENSEIAYEIAEKTSSVSSIASQMEDDINQGFNVLKKNVGQLEEIKTKNDGVISGILALENKITKIYDIIETINAITDQTKVIAFNAALEAASAGEHGKRFSVVSSEVNRLADDIAALTKEIKKQADDIKGSSSSLIHSGKESAVKINEGNSLIKELEKIFNEIKKGAEVTADQAQIITVSSQRQQKSTEQINTAISDISNGLSNFIQSTRIATSSAEDLTNMIHELGNLLSVNNRNTDNLWR